MADASEEIGAGALGRGMAKGLRELQSAAPYADSPHAQQPEVEMPVEQTEASQKSSVIEETLNRVGPPEPGKDDPDRGIDR